MATKRITRKPKKRGTTLNALRTHWRSDTTAHRARAAWLNEFAAADLAEASAREHHRSALEAFLVREDASFRVETSRRLKVKDTVHLPITPAGVVTAQLALRECLRELAAGDWFDFKEPAKLKLRNLVTPFGGGIFVHIGGDLRAMLLMTLAEFVMTAGRQLQFCRASGCQRLLYRERKNQLYCGRACQNRATQSRFRAAHAEERRDAAAKAYKAQKDAELAARGIKAKVARRKRTPR